MSDWLHNLPVPWMALVVFGLTYLMAAVIFMLVTALAVGERARAFKAVSPGMLPPLGIIFGLFVGFTAAQVWTDSAQAEAAVQREASALQSVIVFASALPTDTQNHLRTLVHSYIAQAVVQEWPLMAKRNITLTTASPALADALKLVLGLDATDRNQGAAQRGIITALENALDARRQRIAISQSYVNWIKWSGLYLLAACALLAIALVHSDNRLASALTIALFATGVAACVVLIVAYDRPFIGEISVRPAPLLHVMPAETNQ
jgi:hypothetical protein